MIHKAITGLENNKEGLSSPEGALIAFYKAFNARDLPAMTNNWDQAEHASMSNPLGGIKRGWEEISQVYKNIFHGKAKVYVEFYDYTIHQTRDMFVAVGRERGFLQYGDERTELSIRTSRTYTMNKNRHWTQIHHHGSMDNPELLDQYQTLVLKK